MPGAIICVVAAQVANICESFIGAALQDQKGSEWVWFCLSLSPCRCSVKVKVAPHGSIHGHISSFGLFPTVNPLQLLWCSWLLTLITSASCSVGCADYKWCLQHIQHLNWCDFGYPRKTADWMNLKLIRCVQIFNGLKFLILKSELSLLLTCSICWAIHMNQVLCPVPQCCRLSTVGASYFIFSSAGVFLFQLFQCGIQVGHHMWQLWRSN